MLYTVTVYYIYYRVVIGYLTTDLLDDWMRI